MKSILLFLFLACSVLSVNAQKQVKSGLLINGGFGSVNPEFKLPLEGYINFSQVDYKMNLSVGYRFRFLNSFSNPSVFIDWDMYIEMKSWNSTYRRSYIESPAYDGSTPNYNEPPIFAASTQYYFVSTGGSVNYILYRGLSLGVGLEPSYVLFQEGENNTKKFDAPLLGKLAYDFGFMEVGVNYKYGLTNMIKTDRINSGKFRDWQVSVFIPLSK